MYSYRMAVGGLPTPESPNPYAMRRAAMTPATIELVAERFKALGEPARLKILQALRNGERSVTELGEDTGLNQANLSRHLRYLSHTSMVTRRKHGLFVYYALADRSVLRMCEIMCGRLKS
jgi:DNA-binding transcriptional ArsR family regulator